MTTNCLNCNEEITGNYCSTCSQSATTHRFSLSHVFQHDFIHGIFHIDKGFFYTIKELFTRPGHSIREYVQGKRARHFNYFTTIILLLTLGYFLKKWAKMDPAVLYEDKTMVTGLLKVQKDFSKITAFLHIPIVALMSYLFFRKSKQNYTEHLVLNLYLLCGLLTISLFLPLCTIFSVNKDFIVGVNYFLTGVTFLYLLIFYYQYFSVFGLKKYKLIIRVFLITVLYLLTKQLANNILNYIGLHYFN